MRIRSYFLFAIILIVYPKSFFGQRHSDQTSFWLNIFPFNSNVFGMVPDPQKGETVFATTDRGLFATSNAGLTWNPIFTYEQTDRREEIKWGTLTIDRTAPSVQLLSLSSKYSGTLWRSSDGGRHWSIIGENVIQGAIYGVAINPTSNQIIFAATSTGLYKSLNGGKSWGKVFNSWCANVRIDSQNPERIFFLSEGRFFVSTDGGKTHSEIKITFETMKEEYNAFTGKRSTRKEIAKPSQVRSYSLNPKNSEQIFAACGYSGGLSFTLVQSTDGGKSWVELFKDVYLAAWDYSPIEENTMFVAAKVFHNHTNKSIYKLLHSQDNGRTWSDLNYPTNSDPEELLATQDGSIYIRADGVYRSTDAGSTWTRRHFGLPSNTSGYELLTSDSNDLSFYVAYENGFWNARDFGRHWQFTALFNSRDHDVALKQIIINRDGSKIFLARRYIEETIWKGGLADGIVIKLRNAESGFEKLNLSFFAYFLSVLPTDPNKALLIGAPKAFPSGNYPKLISATDDGGFSWTDLEWSKAVSKDPSPFSKSSAFLAAHPTKPQVFACISDRILLSNDFGFKWLEITAKISRSIKPTASHAGALKSILFDPKDRNAVYIVTQYAGILYSPDGGNSWKLIREPYHEAEIYDFAILPHLSSTFLITTPKGVFQTSDRGASWKSLNDGLLPADKPSKIVAGDSFTLIQGSSGVYWLTNMNLLKKLDNR